MAKKAANIRGPEDADKAEDQAEQERLAAADKVVEAKTAADLGKGKVRLGNEAITEEMVPILKSRLTLSNGTTLQEAGASLAYKYGHPDDMKERSDVRKRMITNFTLKVKEWIIKTYGAERRDANGTIIGYGDRIAVKMTSPSSDWHYRLVY